MSRPARTSASAAVFTVFDAVSVEHELDRVSEAYATVYSEPPYLESDREFADFRKSWARRLSAPDFRLVICEKHRAFAGFTFGYGLRPDTRWWSGTLAPEPDRQLTTETEGRTFVVIELAVLPEFRHSGVGRTLQALLLAGIGYSRVTLLVRPDAKPAIRFYERSGYNRVAAIKPYDGAPIYDAMLLEPPIPARWVSPDPGARPRPELDYERQQ